MAEAMLQQRPFQNPLTNYAFEPADHLKLVVDSRLGILLEVQSLSRGETLEILRITELSVPIHLEAGLFSTNL